MENEGPIRHVISDMQHAYVKGVLASSHKLCKQNTDCCTYGMKAAYEVARASILAELENNPISVEEWNGNYTYMGPRSRETVNAILAERK